MSLRGCSPLSRGAEVFIEAHLQRVRLLRAQGRRVFVIARAFFCFVFVFWGIIDWASSVLDSCVCVFPRIFVFLLVFFLFCFDVFRFAHVFVLGRFVHLASCSCCWRVFAIRILVFFFKRFVFTTLSLFLTFFF